jgi:hypothetical protein
MPIQLCSSFVAGNDPYPNPFSEVNTSGAVDASSASNDLCMVSESAGKVNRHFIVDPRFETVG